MFKVLITNNGTHPASKWAEFAANDIIQIAAQTPTALMNEAVVFRNHLIESLTRHHQRVIDDEISHAKRGKPGSQSRTHTACVVDEIQTLCKGLSFERHFQQDHVREHLTAVCDRYFETAREVERGTFQDTAARAPKKKAKK